MMLGSPCSPCCGNVCGCASQGNFPPFAFVTFSGFQFTYAGSNNNLSDMSGAASHLAAYINSLAPSLSLSFDENDRPIYGTGGCGTTCDDCDPGFVSQTAYSSLSVPADSLRFYFLCTGGARIPFNEFANSQGFWYLATHEDCQPDMPALSVSGGNNSFFQFVFLLPTELESPVVCDFSEGVPEDFEIPVLSHFATWDLPYSSVRGFGNTGSYSGTGGTISVSFANPLP